jgi:hypothetical protein
MNLRELDTKWWAGHVARMEEERCLKAFCWYVRREEATGKTYAYVGG